MNKELELDPVTKEPSPVVMLPIGSILADENNRKVVADEDLQGLVDSIRVLGILQPLHVEALSSSSYRLIDGERRWRAAEATGLGQVPCIVWHKGGRPEDPILAGVVLNDQRKAHSPLDTARRLREIKNNCGLTVEQLSSRTGISVDRIKAYLGLFLASDHLLEFFEAHEVPLKIAIEIMRFEKATTEGRARRLVASYLESPMSHRELVAMRKRATASDESRRERGDDRAPRADLGHRILASFRRDADAALAQVREALRSIGFEVVTAEGKVARATK
jgi:ParB family chromosome partitioning protein